MPGPKDGWVGGWGGGRRCMRTILYTCCHMALGRPEIHVLLCHCALRETSLKYSTLHTAYIPVPAWFHIYIYAVVLGSPLPHVP